MLSDSMEMLSDKSKFINPVFGYDESKMVGNFEVDSLGATRGFVNEKVKNAATYDIAAFVDGTPISDALVFKFATPRAFTINSTATGSIAKAKVAASVSSPFIVKVNGVAIGNVIFEPGQTAGVFQLQSDITLQVGDIFELVSPSVSDTTLSDVAITFVSTLL